MAARVKHFCGSRFILLVLSLSRVPTLCMQGWYTLSFATLLSPAYTIRIIFQHLQPTLSRTYNFFQHLQQRVFEFFSDSPPPRPSDYWIEQISLVTQIFFQRSARSNCLCLTFDTDTHIWKLVWCVNSPFNIEYMNFTHSPHDGIVKSQRILFSGTWPTMILYACNY